MAITVADNFSYQGKKPLDGRDTFTTLAAMKAYAEASVYDGCLSYCDEDGKRYEFKSTNTVDPTTGKWREYSSGGGGHTIQDDGVDMTARDNLNFVGFNVTDDSTNNRTTVTFPNIDLSVLSNEAFQFSPTEKPVGTWTDSNNVTKLVYAKTIFIQSGTLSAGRTNAVPHGVSNIDKKMLLTGALRYGTSTKDLQMPFSDDYKPITNSMLCISSITDTDINISVGSDYVSPVAIASGFVAILYTKTTDSPLPSDVKFAGVLSDGTVVYKKTVSTGGSVPSGATLIYRLPLLNSTDVVYYTLAS